MPCPAPLRFQCRHPGCWLLSFWVGCKRSSQDILGSGFPLALDEPSWCKCETSIRGWLDLSSSRLEGIRGGGCRWGVTHKYAQMRKEEPCCVVSWPFLCLYSLFSASSPPHLTYFLLSAAGFAWAFNAWRYPEYSARLAAVICALVIPEAEVSQRRALRCFLESTEHTACLVRLC